MKKLLITGGAGFIGGHFVDLALKSGYEVSVIDCLTYAGNFRTLQSYIEQGRISFFKENIINRSALVRILNQVKPDAVVNFAAESHVDQSIERPELFFDSNLNGVFQLLEATRDYFKKLPSDQKTRFRFLQVSTDEVFGQLGDSGKFCESSPYAPSSPYSATKAAADHLVRAWFHTYGLPVLITHSTNNYGPRQWPEKLIPMTIHNALTLRRIPVYGNGLNIRDWIFVEDHCFGLFQALKNGKVGESYCLGGSSERTSIAVVKTICNYLDQLQPRTDGSSYENLILLVEDRPGHDYRYSVDVSKAESQIGFRRNHSNFEAGLKTTVQWNMENLNYFSHGQETQFRNGSIPSQQVQ